MAGLGSLDQIYQTFLGQTNDALNEPAAPWQQELMESVNPEKVRRDNIKKALARASMALATTPGNFLTGLSTAAGVGADAYLTAQDDAEQNRARAMQIVQAAQQKQQDRRLSLLMDALGVNRDIRSDKRQEDETTYRRGRDQKADERQAKLDDSLIAYRSRPRSGVDGTSMTSGQVLTTKRAIRRELDGLEKTLRTPDPLSDEKPSEEEIDQQLRERQQELEDYYGISLDDPTDGPQTVSGGKTDQIVTKSSAQPAKSSQPAAIREGTTAVNKQTGERIIFRNGQWQPIL